ncbi:hypothetical protein O0I10_008471 [Lichtheimia ornata]|uniref:Nucleoporin protein Ndc1-Nup n=1 Tax=Lichtheimia ornata TaxID=688661 RepID=A0AAD7XZG6_9FUNG|nr:uncharacterized protein O0I10_008471 [Lichtheimia ornata]KAJ8655807.1 hypothetical protein O0I10_008471 [Lichtheimia ornata]
MASVGATPIFTTLRPADAAKKPTKPTCASFKDAYDAATQRRCRNALIFSYAFSLLATIAFQLEFLSPLGFLNWRTILFSIGLFILTLPLFLIRYLMSSLWRPIAPSGLAELMGKITAKDNYIVLAVYAISGMMIVRSYFSYLMDESYTSNVFFHPHGERFGVRQLNQDNLFISFYGLVLGASFAAKRILLGQWTYKIAPVQQRQDLAIKLSLPTVAHDGTRWAACTLGITYISFFIFGNFVYRMAAHMYGLYTTMLETPVIGLSRWDLYLFFRVFLGGSLAVMTWEIVDRIYDVVFAVCEPITAPYENAHQTLLSGLRLDTEPYLQSIAYAELAELAAKSPEQRKALFKDMGKDMDSTIWVQVSRECMNILAGMRADIAKEYDAGKKPAPIPVKKEDKPAPPNRIQLLDVDVLAKPKASTTILDDRTGKLFIQASTLVTAPDTATDTTKAPKHMVYDYCYWILQKVNKWKWMQDLSAVTAERKIRQVFSNYPIILYAVQALGSLTAASMKEDPYGLVQRDLGAVLDSLLSSVIDVETLVRSPPPEYKKLPPGFKGDVMLMEPEFILLALREAIYQIVTEFRDYLDHIRVSNKYLEKWQRFVEFKE